jgi:serine/threonine protein phosphatase PrpC
MVEAFAISSKGLVRANNEDSLICDQSLQLFVVADGMGGHSAGEVASRLAVEEIERFIRQSAGVEAIPWPFDLDPQLSTSGNRLRAAIQLANRRVFTAAETDGDYSGMGTTVVGALRTGTSLAVGHVGDSRAYLLRGGTLTALTEDDSWVATVLAHDPRADQAELAHHPMRHVLTSVLGARPEVTVHLEEYALSVGDLVLLSSDGLHGLVEAATLRDVLAADGPLPSIADGLLKAALERGGHDNITAVLVRVSSLP